MNITAEEKIMYKVMKAIYDSGIPISFKGSMVLKACLIEAGYDDETMKEWKVLQMRRILELLQNPLRALRVPTLKTF